MAMEIRHTQTGRPEHQTTAHLAQTMSLLRLTSLELRQHIEDALAHNPALEIVHDRRCPTCRKILRMQGPCPFCSAPAQQSAEDAVVFVSTRDDFHFSGGTSSDDLPIENTPPATEDLPTYVLRQIATELEAEERPLAASILTSLDENGLLEVPILEIARFHFESPSRVEAVLKKIQRSDPLGVGSPSSQEALLVQLEALGEQQPVPLHADRAILEGMHLLSKRRYAELGRRLGISTRDAEQLASFISENLNPFPARAHWGSVRQVREPAAPVYQTPDIIISQMMEADEGPLVVEILLPIAGRLRVNPLFRQEVKKADPARSDELKQELENAALLVKCLRQRNHTMVRLMEQIVGLQRKFILRGDAHLRPTTRASLARALGVHESTVSRAVANKAVQMPSGKIIPLARFFDRSLPVRTALRRLISQETRPLSDAKLAELLEHEGIQIARRTVAKYRAMEGILPAHLRQRQSAAAAA